MDLKSRRERPDIRHLTLLVLEPAAAARHDETVIEELVREGGIGRRIRTRPRAVEYEQGVARRLGAGGLGEKNESGQEGFCSHDLNLRI